MLRPLAFLIALAAASVQAGPVDIRTYPASEIRTHEIDRAHGLSSLLLQNLALVNDGCGELTLEQVTLELRRDEKLLQTQVLDAADLAALATRGKALADSGQLAALDFQFGPQLLGAGTTLAATPALKPGQALLVMYRPFLFKGKATALRISVAGKDFNGARVQASRDLTVSARIASGYRFPLRGAWYVAASASFHTAHRWNVAEEFGYDLIQIDGNGSTHRATGTRLRDYTAYGQPVLAARAGRVVRVLDGVTEDTGLLRRPDEAQVPYLERVIQHQSVLIAERKAEIPGNHVVIDHGNGEYSIYAHLVPQSSRLKVGAEVSAGDVIGRLGHSGNSTEPHLHFQVCDGPDPLYCAGIPVQFDDIDLPLSDLPRALQAGDIVIAH